MHSRLTLEFTLNICQFYLGEICVKSILTGVIQNTVQMQCTVKKTQYTGLYGRHNTTLKHNIVGAIQCVLLYCRIKLLLILLMVTENYQPKGPNFSSDFIIFSEIHQHFCRILSKLSDAHKVYDTDILVTQYIGGKSQDCKTLPKVQLICCGGVKLLLPKDSFKFCNKLSLKNLSF